MNLKHIEIIMQNLSLSERQVSNTIELFDEQATIPFIARYRKEATGSLDEVQIGDIKQLYDKLKEIDKRRESIIKSIEEQDKMTDELRKELEETYDLNKLEDLYLPYKKKIRTRAAIAREKGLEPFADIIFSQKDINIFEEAKKYLGENVEDIEQALQGARDIIAENVNENIEARNIVRYHFSKEAIIEAKVAKGKEEEGVKFKDYFDFKEPLSKCASHRLLAIQRGVEAGVLKVNISPNIEDTVCDLEDKFIKYDDQVGEQISLAIEDSYKRLMKPSIENEFSKLAKQKADEEAIRVFAANLRQLLLTAPLGQKRVLAIDPGFASGCKVVCLDAQGNLLHNENIYPHPPQQKTGQAAAKIASLVKMYKIDAIAIGNGTAGRETEHFIKKTRFDVDIQVFIVNENGASIYSASKIAREEFPDYDITVRGAVSIGRRLMDPLAELVKIDAKSIGVGQYQHDVDQKQLQQSLDNVVESSVNLVGVDLNTASKHLLVYVSGLTSQTAQNIVEYRKEMGGFTSRNEIKKVKRLGAKSFEQCAGFLRVTNSKNPLDNSAVHPESYHIVEKMAKDLKTTVANLLEDKELQKKIKPENYVTEKVGLPTLNDIMKELSKPGRDPREKAKVFEFDPNVRKVEDLKEGMVLPGIITNITNFGAFVDVGVKQDGLVHISNLCDKFVSNPADEVSLHQHVKVKVIEVDVARKRIQLSMKDV